MGDLFGQLLGTAPDADFLRGVVVGIVSNNQDPENLGRVKVKFPWLSAEHESHWARVATPMAGENRGFYCLPEVGDEVLVAFAHGSADTAFILGALWNGKHKPPTDNKNGGNHVRMFKSKAGHQIVLNDSEDKCGIRIVDKTGDSEIVIDTAKKKLTIKAKGDLALEAEGDLRIAAKGAIAIEAGKGLTAKATKELMLEAGTKGEIKAGAPLTIKSSSKTTIEGGDQAEVKAATVQLDGTGTTVIKGGVVKIN